VVVDRVLLKHVAAHSPLLVEVAAREEAGHHLPQEMVHPALTPQLVHDRVDEGEPYEKDL